ncbi:MAG: glycosyltransferase family 9 protein [Verrucomicrobia bacterium]|nr:glycosyltransferase family 9 protein [Verrucomicrobiota bacterium]
MNVLVFKVNKLGDNIVFLPVIQAIRQYRPDWRLLLFTNSLAVPLYGEPRGNERYVIRDRGPFLSAWKNPLKLAPFVRTVRQFKPDRCLFASDQGNLAYLLGLASGAPIRIGRRREFHRVPGAINRPEPFDPSGSAALDGWKLLLRLVEDTEGPRLPELPPVPDLDHLMGSSDAQDEGSRSERSRAFPGVPGTPIVIHAGASKDFQRWPSENFIRLANRLCKDHQVYWIRQSVNDGSVLNSGVQVVETPSVAHLVAVLARARLFIGNNSGPFQIASALGIPSVIINGPSSRCWDPFWFPERIRMLRDESVPCVPCEAHYAECRNPRPMQCMNKWTVAAVETETRLWFGRWCAASCGRQTPHPGRQTLNGCNS